MQIDTAQRRPTVTPDPAATTTPRRVGVHWLWFPVAVWALWRLTQLVLVVAAGGNPLTVTFTWDASWYRSILVDGHSLTDPSFAREQNVAFMPLLPWVTRPFAAVLGDTAAMFVVANAGGLAAFIAVYRAARCWLDDRGARRLLWLFALWPFSLFLWTYYTEALFVALVAVGLVGLAQRRRTLVCVAAFLLPMTRTIGVLFAAVAVTSVLVGGGPDGARRDTRRDAGVYAAAGLAGLAVVVAYFHVTVGDGLSWVQAPAAWSRVLDVPYRPFATAAGVAFDALPALRVEAWFALLSMSAAWTAVAVVVVRRRWREPGMLAPSMWGGMALLAPQLSSVYGSTGRYLIAAFPLLAVPLHPTASVWWWRALAAVFAAGTLVTVALFAAGDFVA